MHTIIRQALGVIIGGLIVAALTLAPRASAQQQLTVASLNTPLTIADTNATDKRITYQGMLLDASGQPLNGTFYMVFSIYDSQSSTTPLWTQEFNPATNTGVTVTNGLFTALLAVGKDGTAENLLFKGDNRFLGVSVRRNPNDPLTLEVLEPRQPLLYVPYAYWARTADSLGGKGSRYLPVVIGIVDENGNRVQGTGFSSSRRDEDDDRAYEISIDNVNYELNDYVTIVTPISQRECPRSTGAFTNSNDGKLLVDLFTSDGGFASCKFHFVVYEPED